jgi:hypothetical protein
LGLLSCYNNVFSALDAALAAPLEADGTLTDGDEVVGGGQHQHWHSSLSFDFFQLPLLIEP